MSLSDLTLTRTDGGTFVIECTGRHFHRIRVFAGTDPDSIPHDRPVAQAENTDRVIISGLNSNQRYYFEVLEEGRNPVRLAERLLPLKGTANFRDLGGYFTQDGRQVKWGRVFRSDALDRLEKDDLALLDQIGVRVICDLRSQEEVEERPTAFEVANHIHLPIKDHLVDGAKIRRALTQGETNGLDESLMVGSYRRILDQYADHFGRVLHHLADPDQLPAVFHCTAGKDRTGLTAALLLSVLGVPRETIIADYDLTNTYTAHVVDRIFAQLQAHGVETRNLEAIFSAPLVLIESGLAHLDSVYGGPLGYLEQCAGISPETINALQTLLLYG